MTIAYDERANAPAFDRRGRRPVAVDALIVGAGLLLFAIVWLGQLDFSSLSPPADNIEQLTWVRSMQWGYYKHPPLPTWLLWLPVQVLGLTQWTTYLTGALMTLGAMSLMWGLLVALRGRGYATVALLGALCVSYYNGRLNYYNHNIVLLLMSTLAAVMCWQAVATRRLRWWIGLGLAIGFGALAKYQIAVTALSVLLFIGHQRVWNDPAQRRGVLCAALIALLPLLPHLQWLREHHYATIHYAMDSSLGANFGATARSANALGWLADQVFNRALPTLLLLAATAFMVRGTRRQAIATSARPAARDPARALILAWGLAPLAFMTSMGILTGANLQLQWGTPFLLFLVPALMELARNVDWNGVDLRTTLIAFVLIQALLLATSHLKSPRGLSGLRDRHWRSFDSALLAQRIGARAREALGGPVRVVIGDASIAGALALRLPERPLVLIDGRFDRSPWVPADLVQRCGALELGSMGLPGQVEPVGPEFPGLAWRIVKPQPGAAPCPGRTLPSDHGRRPAGANDRG
ncbi:MAG: glycosyltransferase family 39 protein [Burkholderiaceae bacterium]